MIFSIVRSILTRGGFLASTPRIGQRSSRLQSIEGTVPIPVDLPIACGFCDRCSDRIDGQCDVAMPALVEIEDNHFVRCFLHDERPGSGYMSEQPVLKVGGLKKYFPVEKGFLRRVVGQVKAVDDVSLEIAPGETLGLVGESGSGKTTVGRCILRALKPTQGSIEFQIAKDQIVDMARLSEAELRPLRRYANMIFQDPFYSLDPALDDTGYCWRAFETGESGQRQGTRR